jgi:hypothetical protein
MLGAIVNERVSSEGGSARGQALRRPRRDCISQRGPLSTGRDVASEVPGSHCGGLVPAADTVPAFLILAGACDLMRAERWAADGAPQEGNHDHDRTAPAYPAAAQAAGCGDIPGGDQLVRSAAGRRGQGPPRRSGLTPMRCSGSPPPACAGRPAGNRWAARTSSGGWRGCWTGTAALMPATSTGPCSSSSSGWPPKTSCPTRWPAAAAARHRQAGPGLHRRGAGPAGAGVCGPQLRAAP